MGRRLRDRRKIYLQREENLQPSEVCSSPVNSNLEESSNAHTPDQPVSSNSASIIERCGRIPHLQPITSFSSISGLHNVVLPSGISACASRNNIVNNSTIIEILVNLLCQAREPDTARREQLFIALCKVIKQWNSSLYLPLHAFTEQNFKGLLRQFNFLFEEVQTQITTKTANLITTSFHLPQTGSPLSQLALTDSYQHQFLDDRYSREFLEMSVLGRGGFGVVVKAQNKLDGCIYAIKIIIMDKEDSETNSKLLREVQALAQLDHPHIVRYQSTWLQLFSVPPHLWPKNHSTQELKKQQPHQYFPTSQVKIEELSSSPEPEDLDESSQSSGGIVFMDLSRSKSDLISKKTSMCDTILETGESRYNSVTDDDNYFNKEMALVKKSVLNHSNIKLEYNSTYLNKESVRSSHTALISKGICYKNKIMLSRKHPKDAQMTLFIQMGICGHTLAHWISTRNALPGAGSHVNRKVCLDIFRQILLAVQYIHSKMIIHRDLKPPNIFFTEDGKHIKLGDFGLARPLPDAATAKEDGIDTASESVCLTPIINHSPNTDGVGTPIYAPPELKFGGFYGSKSDMHNLGIILLELFFPFKTGSERIHIITNLKTKQDLDPEFTRQWPDIAPWILKLTDQDQTKRPTASDLLKLKLFSEESSPDTICENVGLQANSFILLKDTERKQKYFQSNELQNQFGNLRISSSKILHSEEHSSTQQENKKKLILKDPSKGSKEKDEEIRRLSEENAKLREKVAQLQEQINQSSAVE